MEAHDFRFEFLDDRAGGFVERRANDRRQGLCRIEPELGVVGRKTRLPARFARGVGLRRCVREEVEVERFRRALADYAEVSADLLRARCGAGERAETAGFGHGDLRVPPCSNPPWAPAGLDARCLRGPRFCDRATLFSLPS